MIMFCIKPVAEILPTIFRNSIDTDTFPDTWKGYNIIPVYKEGDKEIPCLWKKFGETTFQLYDRVSITEQLDPSRSWENQLDPSKFWENH